MDTGLTRATEAPGPQEPPGPADAALVLRARAGDRGALGALYARYARVIHGVLLSAGAGGEAEDLTQEVFVNAMRRLGDLRDPGAVGAWLVASARHRGASWRRERGARMVRLAGEPSAAGDSGGVEAGEEAARVMRAMQTLPEAYRETLVLRLVEGLTGPQIAERTGMTHGSVRVNLHKGMVMLRERLKGVGDE